MGKKETSDEVSSVAAELLAMSDDEMMTAVWEGEGKIFCAKVRKIAASCLSQDETPEVENADI